MTGHAHAKQHWDKANREIDEIHTTCVQKRECCPGYEIYVVPVVVRALGGGIKVIKVDLTNIFDNNKLLNEVVAMMQKIALMDNDSIV